MALGARRRVSSDDAPPSTQLEAVGVAPRADREWFENTSPPVAEVHLQKPALPALCIALLVLALIAGVAIIYYLFYATFALLIITFVWTRGLVQNISVARVLRTKWCVVSDTIHEDFAVRNDGRLPALWVEVRDESTIPGFRPGVVAHLSGYDERRWASRAICRRRGRYHLGPLRVLTGDPFGVFQGAITYLSETDFIVYPELIEAPGLPLPWGSATGNSRSSVRTMHVTTDASGIRQYAPGDPLHRIHWLSSARTGELRSKEFDLEPSGNVWIVLDLDAAVHVGEGIESTEEYAVKLTAAIIHHAIRENKAVGLIAYGAEKLIVSPGKGPQHLWRLMEHLAMARADGRLPLHRVMAEVGTTLGRGLSTVVVTPSTAPTWLNSLTTVRHRTLAPAVILLNQESFGGSQSCRPLADRLAEAGLIVQVVEQGQQFRTIAVDKREWEQQRRGLAAATPARSRVK